MEIGDVVILDKIGSIKMMVIEISDDKATCVYDNGKEVKTCLMPIQFLSKVSGEGSESAYFRLPKK